MNSILHSLKKGYKLCLLLFTSMLIFNNSYSQTAFTVSWPYSGTLSATTTGNVTANAASMLTPTGATSSTPKTFYSQTNTGGFLTSIGEGGIATAATTNTYDAAGSSTTGGVQNIVPIEYSFYANSGNDMSVNSFAFSVEALTYVSGTSISAGYSIDNGVTFTGLAAPSVTGGGTANASPTGSIVLAIGNKFTFTVPACTVPDGGVFKLRVFVWRNNASGSSSSSLKFSGPSITGTTSPYSGPSLTTSAASLSGYNTFSNSPSTSQYITISGVRLDNDVYVGTTATTNSNGSTVASTSKYEMSLDNTNWQKTALTVSKSGNSLADTRVYFRLASGNSVSSATTSQNEQIYISTFRNINGSIISKTLSLAGAVNANYNYTDNTLDISSLSSWKDAANTSPSSFATAYQIFNVLTSKVLNANLAITGTGSKLIIGNASNPAVTFSIPNGFTFTGTGGSGTGIIDISAAQSGSNTLIISNTSIPSFGSINASSTIEINSDLNAVSTGLTSIGNLKINNGGKLKLETITVNGNLNISGDGRLLLNNASSGRTLTLLGNLNIDGSNSGSGGIVSTSVTSSATSYGFNFGGLNKTIFSSVPTGTQSTSYADIGNDFSKINITFVSGSKYQLLSNFNYDFAGSARKITVNSADALDLNGFVINQNASVFIYSAGGNTKVAPMAYSDLQITDGTTATNAQITGPTKIYGNLNVNGTSYITSNDQLTFGATATKTGVINITNTTSTATPFIVGKVSIEKYIGNQRGWNIVSLPFTTNTTLANLATASNIDIDFVRPSVKTFNANNTWTPVASGGSWNGNSGIAIFYKGTSGQGVNAAYTADPSNVTLVVTGNLNSASVTPTSISANTWTLVSNPFPAAISVSSILTSNNLAGAKIAWYDSKANTTSVRVKGGGYYTATPSGAAGSSTDIVISPMGTFFVSNATAGTISITTSNIYSGTYTNSGTLEINNVTDPGIDPDYCSLNAPVLNGIDNPALLKASQSITLSLTTPTTTGGIWTISNNSIATINSSTGVVNGIIPGTVSVTYSVTDNYGCTSIATKTFNVEDANKPIISANSSYTFCSGNSVTLTSSEATGNQWYKDGVVITGATSTTYTATTSGSYTVYVNYGTVAKLSDPRVVTAYTVPAAPTVADNSICIGTTVNIASATASNTLTWYDVSTGGMVLSTAPVANTLAVGTYTYFVSNLSGDGCESPRARINFTVNAIPEAPTVSNLTLCSSNTPITLSANITTGNTAKWYTASTGGTASNSNPSASLSTAGTTFYYVSQISAAGCESSRSALKILVNATPVAPTLADKILCINSTATALTSTMSVGNTAKWYTVATGGTALNTAPIPVTTTVGSTDYYTTQNTAAGCEGPRAKITAIVTSTATPIVQDLNLCNNVTALALTATKTDNTFTFKWYTVATAGTAVTTAPIPSTTAVGTISYYVTQVNPANTCESQRAKIDVITNPIPAPTIISKTADQKLITSGGTNYQWYKDNIIINAATSATYGPTENGKYSVLNTVNGCNSPMSDTYEFINMINKQDGYTINVGPNPFTNFIQLNYTIPSVKTVSISIFSLSSSSKVFEMNDVLPNAKVSINNLVPGVYLVQIKSDDNRIVEKYKMIKL